MTTSPTLRVLHDDRDTFHLELITKLDRRREQKALYDVISKAIAHHILIDRLEIALVDPGTSRTSAVFECGNPNVLPANDDHLQSSERVMIQRVVQDGKSVLSTVPSDFDALAGENTMPAGGSSQLLVSPVVINGDVYGVIKIYSRDPNRFDGNTATTAETYSRMLGLAIAALHARNVPGWHPRADDVLADISSRIMRAETTEQLVDEMHWGLHEATGASSMHFTRDSNGTYHLAESHSMTALGYLARDTVNIASTISSLLPELVMPDALRSDLPKTMLFMDGVADTRPDMQVVPLAALAGLIPTPALVLSPLHSIDEVLSVVVGIWPASTNPDHLVGRALCFKRIGDLVGPALQRLRSLERLKQRVAEIETIRRLTDSIARTPDLHEALGIVCRTAQLLTEQDFIGIAETATGHTIWRAATGALDPTFLHQQIAVPNHVMKRMLHQHQEIATEDVRQNSYFRPEIMPIHMRENLRSSAIIPIYVNSSLRAIMLFGSRQLRTYLDDDIATLHALAATAVTAIASEDARMRTMGRAQT